MGTERCTNNGYRKIISNTANGLLNISGAMRTTPTAAMELITGLTPLDLYVKEVALMAMLRMRTAGVNPLSRSRSIEAKPMARSTHCAASAAGSQ